MATSICASVRVAAQSRPARRPAPNASAGKAFFRGTALRPQVLVRGKGCKQVTSMKAEFDQVGSAYANALVELAQARNALDAVHADIDALQGVMKDDEAVKDFLYNPVIAIENKRALLSKVAQEAGLNEITLNFLNLLIDKDRIVAIEEIFEAFEVEYCKLTETQVATVRSAVRLEQEQQFLIAKKLQELTGSKNIKLKPVIDESLIAGFVVEYGSSQIDLSVKGQLEKISSELQSKAVMA